MVTGDVEHAGTDMKIMLSASGEKGTTTPVELEKASDRFERAREDFIRVGCNYRYIKWLSDELNVDVYVYWIFDCLFQLELEDVGALKKIRVETSASGSRQSWFLERVIAMFSLFRFLINTDMIHCIIKIVYDTMFTELDCLYLCICF